MKTEEIDVVAVEAPYGRQWKAAISDLRTTWLERSVWILVAIRSVGTRYRRTIIGPWWLTLQTLAFVFGLAVLRISLSSSPADLREAIPYVGLGFIAFGLVSGGILAGVNVYITAGGAMSTSRQPYSMYVMRTNTVQFIDFLHDLVAIVALVVIFALPITLAWGWSGVAIVLIVATSIGTGLWLGPMVARYRDLGPLVTAVMRIAFFLTPIFWSIDTDSGQATWAWLNPFTYLVLAFRDPFLGMPHGFVPLIGSTVIAVVSLIAGLLVFVKTRSRLPYWVS